MLNHPVRKHALIDFVACAVEHHDWCAARWPEKCAGHGSLLENALLCIVAELYLAVRFLRAVQSAFRLVGFEVAGAAAAANKTGSLWCLGGFFKTAGRPGNVKT